MNFVSETNPHQNGTGAVSNKPHYSMTDNEWTKFRMICTILQIHTPINYIDKDESPFKSNKFISDDISLCVKYPSSFLYFFE